MLQNRLVSSSSWLVLVMVRPRPVVAQLRAWSALGHVLTLVMVRPRHRHGGRRPGSSSSWFVIVLVMAVVVFVVVFVVVVVADASSSSSSSSLSSSSHALAQLRAWKAISMQRPNMAFSHHVSAHMDASTMRVGNGSRIKLAQGSSWLNANFLVFCLRGQWLFTAAKILYMLESSCFATNVVDTLSLRMQQ